MASSGYGIIDIVLGFISGCFLGGITGILSCALLLAARDSEYAECGAKMKGGEQE